MARVVTSLKLDDRIKQGIEALPISQNAILGAAVLWFLQQDHDSQIGLINEWKAFVGDDHRILRGAQ